MSDEEAWVARSCHECFFLLLLLLLLLLLFLSFFVFYFNPLNASLVPRLSPRANERIKGKGRAQRRLEAGN